MKTFDVTLSVAAGLLGGIVAPYLWPHSVQAQATTPAPKVLEAQAFHIVNETGRIAGSLTIDASGAGVINLFDANGKMIWTTDSKPVLKPAGGN